MQVNHFQSRPLQYNKSQQELFQRKMNIATYLLEKNRKLHKKIDLHGYPDYCENVTLEPSRFRSLKSPTVVLTGAFENSAGRNSVERYCLATGFKADELGVFQGNQRKLSSNLEIQGPQVDVTAKAQSRVSLPFKVPGRKELRKIEMQVFEDENGRDFPIKINQLTVLSGGLWSS